MEKTVISEDKSQSFKEYQKLVYVSYYEDVFRTVYYIIYDKEVTKEIVNEAFLKAFDKIDTLKDSGKFKQWICSIALNLAKNYIRKNSRTINYDYIDNIPDTAQNTLNDNPESILEKEETRKKIREVINLLDDDSRQIILLRFYVELSYDDISKYMNMNIGTLKSKLYRAKMKMYEFLKIEGEIND